MHFKIFVSLKQFQPYLIDRFSLHLEVLLVFIVCQYVEDTQVFMYHLQF